MKIDKAPKKVDMRVTLACRVYIISRSIIVLPEVANISSLKTMEKKLIHP